MTSFKKFVSAKERVEENHIPKTMNKNFFIRKEINENDAASTDGGEIDDIFAAVGAAAALLGKSIYNGAIYAKLKAELPNYLKQYKNTEAPKSRSVWDEAHGEKLAELKKTKATLLGKGNEREDRDADRVDDEESAKDKIKKMFKAKKDSAQPEQKDAIQNQEEAALAKVDAKIQQLQKQIELAEVQRDKEWEQAKEEFRQYDEKFKEKQDGFIEVRDSVLASSWRKRWDKEFTIAKNQANIEVLEQAGKIAAENNDKKELEAIRGAQARAKETEAAAEEALKGIESDAEESDRMQADAAQFAIPEYLGALATQKEITTSLYDKWSGRAEKADKEGVSGGKKDALKFKIEKAEGKLKKAEEVLNAEKEKGDDEKAAKIQTQIEKIKNDIAAYKKEFESNESFDDNQFYSLSSRVYEASVMLDKILKESQLFEAEKNPANFSGIQKAMMKAIHGVPQEGREAEASEAIKDIEKLADAEKTTTAARNTMADKFEENAGKDKEDRLHLPKDLQGMKKLGKVDDKTVEEKYSEFITKLEEDGGKKAEKTDTDSNQGEGETDTNSNQEKGGTDNTEDPEAIATAEQEVKTTKEEVKNAKDEKHTLDNNSEAKEKDKIDAEIKVIDAEIKEKEARQKLANLKGKDNDVKNIEKEIKKDNVKKAELNRKKEELKNGKDADESVETVIPSKFMKFEDYLSMKQKNI